MDNIYLGMLLEEVVTAIGGKGYTKLCVNYTTNTFELTIGDSSKIISIKDGNVTFVEQNDGSIVSVAEYNVCGEIDTIKDMIRNF